MNKDIVIYGNGSVAKVVHQYLRHDSSYKVNAFTIEQKLIGEKEILGLPIIPFESIEDTYPPDKYRMFVAVGYTEQNKVRARIYEKAKSKGYEFINYISSRACVDESLKIGDNCIIAANTVIQPFVEIGKNVIIKENVFIAHDTIIQDHCFISGAAAISGKVKIGKYTFIGTNATLRNEISLGDYCIIGAGVTLLNNVNSYEVYINNNSQKLPLPSDKIKI